MNEDAWHFVVSMIDFVLVNDEDSQADLFTRYQGLDPDDILKEAAKLSATRFEYASKVFGVPCEELLNRGWEGVQRTTDDPAVLNSWLRALRMTLALLEGNKDWFAETYHTIDNPILQLRAFVDNLVVLQNSVAELKGVSSFAAEYFLGPDKALASE